MYNTVYIYIYIEYTVYIYSIFKELFFCKYLQYKLKVKYAE